MDIFIAMLCLIRKHTDWNGVCRLVPCFAQKAQWSGSARRRRFLLPALTLTESDPMVVVARLCIYLPFLFLGGKCRHYWRWLPRLPFSLLLLVWVGVWMLWVRGSQWMSPLIHILIKQPALCLSHGLYPSLRLCSGQMLRTQTCTPRLAPHWAYSSVWKLPLLPPLVPTSPWPNRNNKQ